MKLLYLSSIIIPSPLANRLQIMKTSEAFSMFCDFKLYVAEKGVSDEEIFNYYRIKRPFEIVELGMSKLCPRSFFYTFKCLRAIRKERPDYIFIREPHLAFFLSFFCKNLIYGAHTFVPRRIPLYLWVFKRIKGIIALTKKLRNSFIRIGIPQDKILVAPDAVDLEDFDVKESKGLCRKKLNLPLDKKIIGYVGQLKTMGEEKGIGQLIRSLKIIKEKYQTKAVLCVVGGRESDILEYKELAQRVGLSKEDIIFTGQVKHELVSYYLRSFDALAMLFPWNKHYAYYMSPLKMFEYMAAKRPIIASDLPSVREILNDNNAILVKPEDVHLSVKAIEKVLNNPDLAKRISEQAYKDVQKYTWEKRAKRIINFLRKNLR